MPRPQLRWLVSDSGGRASPSGPYRCTAPAHRPCAASWMTRWNLVTIAMFIFYYVFPLFTIATLAYNLQSVQSRILWQCKQKITRLFKIVTVCLLIEGFVNVVRKHGWKSLYYVIFAIKQLQYICMNKPTQNFVYQPPSDVFHLFLNKKKRSLLGYPLQ